MPSLDYRNPADCLAFIKDLPLTNLDASHPRVSEMVATLLAQPPAPNQHLEVLEAAREAIVFLQFELGQRYAAHPLPPNSREEATLQAVIKLWIDLARSYALILRGDMESRTLEDQYALLAQRRIQNAGNCLLEYFRAHRAVPIDQWSQFHDSYAVAEKMGLAQTRISDPLNDVWKAQSGAEAYCAVLLVDLANPYGRNQREFQLVCQWAQRFAPYCGLAAPSEGEAPGKYGLDLAVDQGLRPIGLLAPSLTLRRFDGQRLASQIQAALTQLKQGMAPASLGLGEDCAADTASRILISLYRPWGLAAAGRKYPRRASRGIAEVVSQWEGIAFYIEGQPFVLPKKPRTATGLATDLHTMTFGTRADDADWDERRRASYVREHNLSPRGWQVVDQSVSGFRLQRKPEDERTEHRQLIAIKPSDGKQHLLAIISWLMFRQDNFLEAGIYILPGLPRAIAIRSPGLSSQSHNLFELGFMLPAVPALQAEATLVVPLGWYQADRPVEIRGEPSRRVRMVNCLVRGANFEQVTFTNDLP